MNRRDFIKLGGLASLSLFAGFSPLEKLAALPVEMAANGKVYRGTHDGKIFISEDGGKTWRLHINLGKEYAVNKFYAGANNQVQAQIGFQQYTFGLTLSKNGRMWLSGQNQQV